METSPGIEHETAREAKLFASIGKKDFQIEELQRENAALRAQVESLLLLQQRDDARGVGGNTSKVGHLTAGQMTIHATRKPGDSEHEALKLMHRELDWRYKSLEALHRGCEGKINALDAKCKDYKTKCKLWADYLGKTETRPSTSVSEHAARRDHGEAAIETPSAEADRTPRPAVNALELTLGSIKCREQVGSVALATRSSPLAKQQSSVQAEQPQETNSNLGSSQTTVSIEWSQHPPSGARTEVPNSSDEEPELISERCLKRRAPRASARQSPPRRIKRESSSPSGAIVLSSDGPPESCGCGDECHCDDLDYIKPRSQQSQLRNSGNRANSVKHVSVTPALHRSASSISEGDPRAHVSAPVSVKSKFIEQVREPLPVGSTTITSPQGNKEALKTLSANVPLLPRKRHSPKSTPKHGRKSARGKISVLSEDGDDPSQVIPSPHDAEVPALRKDTTLDGLLMGHSSDRTPDVPHRLLMPELKGQTRSPAQFRTPVSLFKGNSPIRRHVATPLPRGIEPPPPSPRPEEEPLRLRDVRTLRLDDFKINSKYLGSDFAFADTLRGRDQRRLLHVCTKSDCCGGAMKNVIAMGGQKVSGKTDAQALDDYLGPQYKQIMGTYDAEKQKTTVLQAHVYAFTKQHGKHRQAFERQSTPPNFWRTDFATTQENMEDRQKALEKDRLDVEVRRREAMRKGGRWQFRDE